MSEAPLVRLAGVAKDYPKVATGGDRLRTLVSLMLRSGDFPHFRALEDSVVRLLALKHGDVIATGGGLPCDEGRLEALRAVGTIVWLAGDFATLYERALRGGDRPMLHDKTREQAEALYEGRRRFYSQADLSVETCGFNPDQVAARVAAALSARQRQAV